MGRGIFQERVVGDFGGEEFGIGLESGEAFLEVGLLFIGGEEGGHAMVDGGNEGIGPGGEHGEAGAVVG